MPTKVDDQLSTVDVGETYSLTDVSGVEADYTVAEKCECNHGHWICVSCDRMLETNFEKDAHIGTGEHVMAWACTVHSKLERP